MTDQEIMRALHAKWRANRRAKRPPVARPRIDPVESARARSRKFRLKRSGSGQCINGLSHGPANGVRCDWCRDVHRRGLAAVLAAPKFARPPITKWRKR